MSLRRFMERNVSVHSSAVSRANPTAEKFLKACEDGDLTMVKKMVEKKEVAINESDSYRRTGLHFAVRQNHSDIVKYLLRSETAVDWTDREGATACIVAAKAGHKMVVRILVCKFADIDYSPPGVHGQYKSVRFYASHKADVKYAVNQGLTHQSNSYNKAIKESWRRSNDRIRWEIISFLVKMVGDEPLPMKRPPLRTWEGLHDRAVRRR